MTTTTLEFITKVPTPNTFVFKTRRSLYRVCETLGLRGYARSYAGREPLVLHSDAPAAEVLEIAKAARLKVEVRS